MRKRLKNTGAVATSASPGSSIQKESEEMIVNRRKREFRIPLSKRREPLQANIYGDLTKAKTLNRA